MMSLDTHSPAHSRQSIPPTLEEEDDFYAKVLGLRDAVIAGTHPTLKLPSSAIATLKASLLAPESSEIASQGAAAPKGLNIPFTHGAIAGTNEAVRPAAMFPGLPGLGSSMPPTNGAYTQRSNVEPASAGLDPIFLEKSDSLVRAEGQLKRQRIERDLFDHWENRKHASVRDKEAFAEGPSNISIDVALANAQKRVKPLSGLKSAPRAASVATSFDENDYYSSQVQSEWSSDAGSGNGPDQAVGAFGADVENLDRRNHGAPASASKNRGKQHAQANAAPRADVSSSSKHHPHFYANEPDAVDEADDEDEEYSPPEPAAFDSFYNADSTMENQDVGADDDDDSEYEPGELTQDSVVVTPYPNQASAQPSLQVPIFRNHLSHIAAPQPNRVSPLAVQKGPSIELELVNGRPEVVHKPQKRAVQAQSRPSSASPSGPGTGQGSKKKKNNNKKRKREQEALNRSKKRQERQIAQSPPSPSYQETYIKPEPVSPPPFANVPEVSPYPYKYTNQAAPIQIDPDSPRHPSQPQYVYASTSRYEHAPQMPPPNIMRVSSASGYRPPQRDTQDLRRVASLHYAQRPPSPTQRVYSPAGPYTTNGRVYAEPRQGSVAPYAPRDAPSRYLLAESRQEPLCLQEYREASPAMMPPPSAPPRRIVVDQYGNKYYAAEPAPHSRASVAPVARQPEPDLGYDRAPSRMSGAYQLPPQQAQYEPVESSMPPPPPPIRRHVPQEQAVEYVDANGQTFREYSTRPADPIRYSHAPISPVYQQPAQYEQMPPPPARPVPREPHYEQMPPPPMPQPLHESTSPVYAAPPRAYSVRPEGREASQITYAPRQASVAPVQQYVRHEAAPPSRAMSVMPEPDYGAPVYQQRAPSYAPQPAVRYVDEYGREVASREMRQASQFRY